MSSSIEGPGVAPPRRKQALLSILLIALFSPVVLAVGSPAFRPAWLQARLGGVPISVVWILVSILTFVALTWVFASMAFVRADASASEGR